MKEVLTLAKEIIVHGGHIALVDDEDYPVLSQFRWYLVKGYAYRSEYRNGKTKLIPMHHQLLPIIPKGMRRDHKNRNRLDNRRENLRICTPSQNTANSKACNRVTKTSRYKGVGHRGRSQLWSAVIGVNGKYLELGSYEHETDAAIAYDSAARFYYAEFAATNFPGTSQTDAKTLRLHAHQLLKERTTSRYIGVFYYASRKKWKAHLNGKHLGYFPDEATALDARQCAEAKLSGAPSAP